MIHESSPRERDAATGTAQSETGVEPAPETQAVEAAPEGLAATVDGGPAQADLVAAGQQGANSFAPAPPARRFLAVAPWPRALGETAVVAALMVALSLFSNGAPFITVTRIAEPGRVTQLSLLLSMMLLVGPAGCALWLAARLRIPSGQQWYRALPAEALLGLLLAVAPSGILLYLISRFASSNPARTPEYLTVWIIVSVIFALSFIVYRAALRLWFWWDALRRRRLQWALTHALLSVAVAGAALLGLAVLGGVIALSRPGAPLFQWITAIVFLTALIVIGILCILPPVALFSYFFARGASRRILSLVRATGRLRAGDLSVRLPVEGSDEVAQLQRNFNDMAADLEEGVRALRAERDEVARLLQQRRELVASVSHELRTPVATLRGYLDSAAMRWEDSSPGAEPAATLDLRHDLEVMRHETERLQSLIDDLFTLARAEVGRLELSMEVVDLGAVARRAVETLAPLAWRASRVEVVARVTPETPPAWADPARVEQALHNLLRNAMRHTPPGGIIAVVVEAADGRGPEGPSRARDGARAGPASPGAGWVALRVRDTGEGIPADDLPHIFERFYRSDRARALDASAASANGNGNGNGNGAVSAGSGLGLALVKEVVEAMGGGVAVESTAGQGSAFSLLLPVADVEQARPRRTGA